MNDFTSGTQFDFTYAPGTSQEQILGFEMAGEVWSSLLADDVTVRIHVESTSDLPDEVIGAALPGKKRKREYKEVGPALLNDININNVNIRSKNDITAFNNLPSYDEEFSIIIDGQELGKTKDFKLTNANAKSLGLLRDEVDKLDGYILVNDLSGNSSVGWDYDALRSDGASGNDMDFLSVAMHEIGHVLGFVSGIDDNNWLKTLAEAQEKRDKKREEGKDEEVEIKEDDFEFASILDLYRYNYSDNNPPSGKIDLSMGGNPYFSIDGGETNLGNFASGEDGDGYQASHWKHGINKGIMNPVLPKGQRRDISELDLTAFDVIGWDINTAPAPSWDELYENAKAGVETANIQERDKDIEKLIKESGYDLARRSRRSRYSSYRRYSFQLGGFWQLTTLDTVDTSEAIEAIVSDTPIVETEPEVVTEIDNIDGMKTKPNVIVSDDTTIAEPNVVTADVPVVETEPNATSDESDDIAQTEVEIIDNSNLELIDNNAIALNELTIESEPEIVVNNETEVQLDPIVETDNIQPADIETLSVNETTVTESVIEQELIVVNNITENSPNSSLVIDPNQSLVNTNLNKEELVITQEIQMDNDNVTELAAVEAEYDAIDSSNNDDEDDETENSYGYTRDNSLALQSVTGVADSEQDSLFYTNYW